MDLTFAWSFHILVTVVMVKSCLQNDTALALAPGDTVIRRLVQVTESYSNSRDAA